MNATSLAAFPAADRAALGRALRDRRTELGLTQRQVEEASRVTQSRISRIERGGAETTLVELGQLSSTLQIGLRIVLDTDTP